MRKELSWKPKHTGEQYCAPACGRGCTRTEYEQAVILANDLLHRLEGPGWKVGVWENLGWHYSVTNGWATVYPADADTFYCLLSNEKGSPGGLAMWSDDTYSSDPNECVRNQYRTAQNKIKQLTEAVYSYFNP